MGFLSAVEKRGSGPTPCGFSRIARSNSATARKIQLVLHLRIAAWLRNLRLESLSEQIAPLFEPVAEIGNEGRRLPQPVDLASIASILITV